MASPRVYVKESAAPLGQQPKVCETQFPDTHPTSQRMMRCGVKETTWDHSTLVKEVHDWHRMLWANHRYAQGRHRPDHMLWRHMSSTAHMRVSEKVTKKQVMMFPVIYASQSFSLPRQPTILLNTQSQFLSPPVPLTSSCHYIFFEIPLMKNESPFPANTGWSLWHAILLGRCSGRRCHPAALPDLSYTPPRKECFWESSWRKRFLLECGWEPAYKLATPVGHNVEKME